MHPAVRQGVVLAAPLDLEGRAVGIHVDHGGPRALLAKVDHLGGPPIPALSKAVTREDDSNNDMDFDDEVDNEYNAL